MREPAPFAPAPLTQRTNNCLTTISSAFSGAAHSSAGRSFSLGRISSSFDLGPARLELVKQRLWLRFLIRTVRRAAFYRMSWLTTLMAVDYCAGASVAATPSFVLADATGTEQSSRYCIAAFLLTFENCHRQSSVSCIAIARLSIALSMQDWPRSQ